MHQLTTVFLYAFLLDGVLSVLTFLFNQSQNGPLALIAAVVTIAVLLMGLALFGLMVITPRLSKRLLLAPVLFLGFSLVWFVILGEKGALPLSIAETLLALGIIVGFKDPSGSRWTLQYFTGGRPFFTFKNFILTGLLHGALALGATCLLFLGLAQTLRGKLEDSTGHYVSILSSGIAMEERTFQRGDKEIRLIGMIHIAKSGFYDAVAKTLPPGSNALVLLEGFTDRSHRLKGKFDYARLALLLGISSQKDSSFQTQAANGLEESAQARAKGETPENLEYRNADVDLEIFRPETVRFIQTLGTLLNCESVDEALAFYKKSQATFEADSKYVMADILDKRNEHLIEEIHSGLETHSTLVVPWGARHMPVIQSRIEAWGFKETQRMQRQAVPFHNKTLIGFLALLDRLPKN